MGLLIAAQSLMSSRHLDELLPASTTAAHRDRRPRFGTRTPRAQGDTWPAGSLLQVALYLQVELVELVDQLGIRVLPHSTVH